MAKKTPTRRKTATTKHESAPGGSTTTEQTASENAARTTQQRAVSVEQEEQPSFAVVGIGASAGGLEAFQQLFSAMPADTGMAFVLIQHLDPTHQSLTAELLRTRTGMHVVEVQDEMRVEANRVHVIPPNRYLSISGWTLHLSEPVKRRGVRVPIDFFFRSLADDQQQRAIGIILSGSGTDGTLGVREIKAAGGMVMVQSPETCQFDGMPRSALATGVVDRVLPIEEMPEVLMGYVQHGYINGAVAPTPETERSVPKSLDHLQTIIGLLRARLKYDFGSYKKGTLTRRVQRRMGLGHIEDMGDYVELLRQNKDEVSALYKDLLISVTNFFREPEAWQVLEKEVIEPLVREHDGKSPIRVWVPGCATGEEAYSFAMLLTEQLQAADRSFPLQIFASDIDQDALAFARAGIYPENIAADVSPERLRQFFIKGEHTFRINKEIREAVLFAEQNLISDPPFSKLDLISCRNLMIYLEADLQKKIVALFHFALNEGGYLFLGGSETVGQQHDLFEPVSRKQRIYRRIGPTRLSRIDLPIAATTGGARHTEAASHNLLSQPRRHLQSLAQHLMLQRFAPACVLINRKSEALFLSGPVDRYLQLPPGELASDLLAMARPGLRTKVRAAIQQAIRDDESVLLGGLRVTRDGKRFAVRLTVEPLHQPREAEGLLMVAFDEESDDERSRLVHVEQQAWGTPDELESPNEYESFIRQLEDELRVTREELQSTIEELETSNEEFKASNEEVVSINEELQSTNEELETSQEELRSLNEELQTVNSQLEHKVDQLETANNDLSNLLSSTEIATLCLDRQLRIKWFTPAMTRLVNLRGSDEGRPLADFAQQFTDTDLLPDADTVLQRLAPIEKQVKSDSGEWYLRRISPYRTEDDRIDGVVITFVDITRQMQDAFDLQASQERFGQFMQHLPGLAWIKDREGRYVYVNAAAEQAFQVSAARLRGKTDVEVFPPETAAQFQANDREAINSSRGIQTIESLQHADGIVHRSIVGKFPIVDADGTAVFVGGMAIDITELLEAQESLRAAQEQLKLVTDTMPVGVTRCSHDMRYLWVNEPYARTLGRSVDDIVGHSITEILGDELFEQLRPYFEQVLSGQKVSYEQVIQYPGSQRRWVKADYSPVQDASGRPDSWVAVIADITDQKQAEQALRESEARFRAMTDSAPMLVWMSSEDKRCNYFNETWLHFTGRTLDEELADGWAEGVHPEDLARCLDTYVTAFDDRKPFEMEYRLRHHDGKYRWILDRGVPRFSPDMTFLGYVGSCVDIHDRKQAAATLIRLNEQLEQLVAERTANTDRLLEQAPDALVVISRQGEIMRINQLTVSLFGYTRGELLGQPVEVLLPEDFRAQHPALRDSFFANPRLRAMGPGLDLFARHRDGHDFPVEIQLTPLVIDGQQVAAASIRDITERKQFHKTQARLAAIMHNASTAVSVLDENGTIVNWNLGAERLFGYSAKEIVGQPILRLVPPERANEIEQDQERLTGDQFEVDYNTVRLHKDGTPIDVSITKSQILQARESKEFLVITRDVRRQKQLEMQMAEWADAELQRLGRELHDTLGQECTAIGMFAATLKKQLGETPKHKEVIDRLEHSADRAKKQLRLLIKGLFPVDLDAAGLRVALEDLADETSSAHELDCHFECRIPIHVQDNFVATQLYLVIREAVHNAVKHAKAKRIIIRIEESTEGLLFTVHDVGLGMKNVAEEPAGMGLHIMRHRCSLIGAQLRLSSEKDGGTTVGILLRGGVSQ